MLETIDHETKSEAKVVVERLDDIYTALLHIEYKLDILNSRLELLDTIKIPGWLKK